MDTDTITLRNGQVVVHFKSCENMDDLESGSVQLCVTSPPYYLAKLSEEGVWDSYDDYLKFLKRVLKEIYRVMSPGRVLIFNVADYTTNGKKYPIPAHSIRIAEEAGFEFRDDIIWRKQDGQWTTGAQRRFGMFIKTGWPLYTKFDNVYEHLIVLVKGKLDYSQFADKAKHVLGENSHDRYKKFGRWKTDVWDVPSATPSAKGRHPLAFPEIIPYNCILFHSLPGETVLDPFAGGGTTLKVAYHMNRRAVGYETRPDEPIVATSAVTGKMKVPVCNRKLIEWNVNKPLKVVDRVQAKNKKISDY